MENRIIDFLDYIRNNPHPPDYYLNKIGCWPTEYPEKEHEEKSPSKDRDETSGQEDA